MGYIMIELLLLTLIAYLYIMAGAGVTVAWYEKTKTLWEALLVFILWPAIPTYLLTKELLK